MYFGRRDFLKKSINIFTRIIKKNFLSLLGFEFIFRISIAFVFIPAIIKIVNLIMNNYGIVYITSKNISDLSKNPVMLLVLLVGVLVIVSLTIFESNCLTACFQYSMHDKKINITNIFLVGYSKMRSMLARNKYKSVLWMLLVLPIYNLHFIIVLCEKVDILGTLLKHLFKGMPFAYIGIILTVTALFAVSFAMYRFGAFYYETGESIKKRGLVKGCLLCLTDVTVTNLFVTLIILFVYIVLILSATLILRFFGDSHLAFARLIRFESSIYYFIAFFASITGAVFNTAMIYVFNHKYFTQTQILAELPGLKKIGIGKNLFRNLCVAVLIFLLFIVDITTIIGYVSNGSHFLEEMLISTSVTAHRGGAGFAPENTMDAVRYSIESGADYIEIDVQMSADGVIIVLHDDNLKRTTGYNQYAYKMNYKDIVKLDAGSYFSDAYAGAYIPTLEEVLVACKGKININIELKKLNKSEYEFVDKVIDLIYEYDMQEQCVITSTAYSYLRYVKKNAPELRTGFIANMLFGDAASLQYADFFSVKYVVVTENFIKAAHEAGKEVHVWTVNTKLLMNRMKGLDVDSIITDNPVLCKKILSRKNDRRSFAELLQTILQR